MYFKNKSAPISLPSILVLQAESVLLQFEKNSSLPLRLETNNVCDCVCLIIYSKVQGIAYLAHIYLTDLDEAQTLAYKNSLDAIVQQHHLNSENSFVALIGAQDRTLELLMNVELILKKHFTSIFKENGGNNYIQRCIELSKDKVEFLSIDCSNNQRKLFYQKKDIDLYYNAPSSIIYSINYYNRGSDSISFSQESINELNGLLKDSVFLIKFSKN